MRMNQKFTYKARNYFYEKGRNKQSGKTTEKQGFFDDFLSVLDELDEYIEQQVSKLNMKRK